MKAKIKNLFVLSLVLICISSCAPIIQAVQPANLETTPLSQGTTLGQTFTANFDGLQEIRLHLTPGVVGNGFIELALFNHSIKDQLLETSRIPLNQINEPGWYTFSLPPLDHSNQNDYYFELILSGSSALEVGTGNPDSYIDGSLFVDSSPADGQLAFQLGYKNSQVIKGFINEFLSWLAITAAALYLYVLPGWLILGLIWKGWGTRHWLEKIGYSVGLSLSIYPLLFLWMSVFDLQLGKWFAILPGLVILLVYIWFMRDRYKTISFRMDSIKEWISWQNITLIIIIGLIFSLRFWVIRTLHYPLWGDGHQHTMITQLLIDNHGLFSEWYPYAELQTLTYHFGFHAHSAVLSWITRLPANEAVLYTGQLVNGFAVLTLFPLAMRIRRSILAGTITVLLAGIVFSMPLFFVNWSRYTQLSGLAILAIFTSFCWGFFSSEKFSLSKLAITGVLLSGLALTHYRVLIFALTFMLAYAIFYLRRANIRALATKILGLTSLVFVLTLPWVINIFAGKLTDILNYQVSTSPGQVVNAQSEAVGIGNLFAYLPVWVWIILPLMIGWEIWRRQKGIVLLSLWWLLTFLLANPQWFNLPGAGILTSFAVLISLYFPAALIIGEGSAYLIEKVLPGGADSQVPQSQPVISSWANAGLAVVLIVVGLLGTVQRRQVLDKYAYSLITNPDIRAAEWIKDSTPADATFLVNSFFAYGGSLIAGSDGGWWLPLSTGRASTLPPITYGAEQGPTSDYAGWINSLTATIEQKGIAHPEVIKMLEDRAVTHVYVGQRQGLVGTDEPLFNLDELLSSSSFNPIYHQDRVWVFEFVPG